MVSRSGVTVVVAERARLVERDFLVDVRTMSVEGVGRRRRRR